MNLFTIQSSQAQKRQNTNWLLYLIVWRRRIRGVEIEKLQQKHEGGGERRDHGGNQETKIGIDDSRSSGFRRFDGMDPIERWIRKD